MIASLRSFVLPLLATVALAGCADETSEDPTEDGEQEVGNAEEAFTNSTLLVVGQSLGNSIQGVKIGMNASTVVSTIKGKRVVTKVNDRLLGKYERYRFGTKDVNTQISVGEVFKWEGTLAGGVFKMVTNDPAVRTAGGIGVGSKRSEIDALPGMDCNAKQCSSGGLTGDRNGIAVAFDLKNNRVVKISIGYGGLIE